MKLKLDQTRTYDKDGFRRRAACLCLRSEENPDILLVSSGSKKCWIVPGGGIDPGEAPDTAALREIEEEAGARGKMIGLLDVFENTAKKTRTHVYVVVVENLADEFDDGVKIGRVRRWFSLKDAFHQLNLHRPVQSSYVKTYMDRKATGTSLVTSQDSAQEQLSPGATSLPSHSDGSINVLVKS